MTVQLTGSCLCGAIAYTVDAPITELRACHCVHCQKASGAGGSVNAVVPSAAFKITRGAPKHYATLAASGRVLNRYFCSDCGSPLYNQRANNTEYVVLRVGTLDGAPDMRSRPTSGRRWAWIDPTTKQYAGQPDAPATK